MPCIDYFRMFRRQMLNLLPLETGKNSQKRDEIADKIEQLCMGNYFIYGYRTIK